MSQSDKRQNSGLRIALPLFFALIMNAAAHAYFTITFPALGRELKLTDLDSSLILSISAVVMMLAAPGWGWLCESWGRRRVILTGLIVSACSSITLALVIGIRSELAMMVQWLFLTLLTIRIVHTALSAGVQPAAQAVIADLTLREGRARGMGFMGAAFGLGTIAGGFLALLSGSHYLVAGFLCIAAMLSVSVVVLVFNFQETGPAEKQALQAALPLKAVLPYLLTTLLGLSMYSALQQITSWRLQDGFAMASHQSVQFTGAIMMATMIAMIVTQGGLVVRLKWSAQKLRLTGLCLIALALLVATVVITPFMLLAVMMMLGLGLGMLLPGNLALLSLAAGNNQQGKIAGINGMCQGAGLALGPVSGSLLYNIDMRLPYLLAGILFTLLTIYGVYMLKRTGQTVSVPG